MEKTARLETAIISLDNLTPNTVYAPTSWEVIRALQHARTWRWPSRAGIVA